MIRFWYEADAIQIDGALSVPPRSLTAVLDGDRVHVLTLSGFRLSQSVYGEYARKDGSGFASAAVAKAYLDAEFAKAPSAAALAVTPAVSSRALGTTFQPSATRPVAVSYSARTQVTNPLLVGASTATVVLLSDANNPPTTERARVSAESSVGVAVAVAIATSNTAPLSYIVPPGHFVRLVSTVTGTGASSIVSQVEEVLG